MTILITGAAGRIGVQVMDWARDRGRDVTPLDLPDDLFAWRGEAETVLHFAIDWADAARTFEMTRHLLEHTQGLKRFVLASSITICPHSGFEGLSMLGAAKLASEAWARAWAFQSSGVAVALRLGRCGFQEDRAPTEMEEAVRLSRAGLWWWLDKAMGPQPCTGDLTIWNTVGNGGVRSTSSLYEREG